MFFIGNQQYLPQNKTQEILSEIKSLNRQIKDDPCLSMFGNKVQQLKILQPLVQGFQYFWSLLQINECCEKIIELYFNFQLDQYENQDENQYFKSILEEQSDLPNQINLIFQNAQQQLQQGQFQQLNEIEKVDNLIIVALQKDQKLKWKFFIELLQIFDDEIKVNPKRENEILQKKLEFCYKAIDSFQLNSQDHLQVIILIFETYDRQVDLINQNDHQLYSECIKKTCNQKLDQLYKLTDFELNFKSHYKNIQKFEQLCQNFEITKQKVIDLNDNNLIRNLIVFGKLYLKIIVILNIQLRKNRKDKIYLSQAKDIHQQINNKIFTFQGSEEELLDLYLYQQTFTQSLIEHFSGNNQILYFEQLVILQEQICKIDPKNFQFLVNLSSTLNSLIFFKKDDIKLKYVYIQILDKMIKINKKFKMNDYDIQKNNLFQIKAKTYFNIAKLTENLNEKEKIFDIMLQCSEEACQLESDDQVVKQLFGKEVQILQQLDYLLSIPLQLGCSNIMNQYYDQALKVMEDNLNQKILSIKNINIFSTIQDQFRFLFKIIHKRLVNEELNLFIEKFIKVFDVILAVSSNKKVATLLKGQALEQLGDQMGEDQNHYYYNKALETYETIRDVKSNAVKEDMSLLQKTKQKLKAISQMKQTKLFQTKYDQQKIYPIWFRPCSDLELENNNLREALIIYRITNTHISMEGYKRQIVYDL